MINVERFIKKLNSLGVDYFAGVPDSLLKSFCAYVTKYIPVQQHVITANEGAAIGLGMGYHMATGKIPLIYLQNSGVGNLINPLLSLADSEIYSIPMLILVGWRGEPGFKDEPQHIKQGRVMCQMLDAMEQPYLILDSNPDLAEFQLKEAVQFCQENDAPYFLIVPKDTFAKEEDPRYPKPFQMSREFAIQTIIQSPQFLEARWVATTGMISRELFETRRNTNQRHEQDFLTVGGMGHASAIALGLALNLPNKKIICLDGDGAALMHLGTLAIIGQQKLNNFCHILLNNGAHDSVGGQPTVALQMDWPAMALSIGYTQAFTVSDSGQLQDILNRLLAITEGAVFIEVRVNRGNRADLGRPGHTPKEAKEAFMQYVKD